MSTYTYEELEDNYEQYLSDLYPDDIDVCGYKYQAGALLKSIDPIAFRAGVLDYLDGCGFNEVKQGDDWVYTLEDDGNE